MTMVVEVTTMTSPNGPGNFRGAEKTVIVETMAVVATRGDDNGGTVCAAQDALEVEQKRRLDVW